MISSCLHEKANQFIEVKTRAGKSKATFARMKNFLTRKDLDLSVRLRMVWCYIAPVPLYDMETWTLSKELEKCSEMLEMYIYRRLLKISLRNKVTNVKVLRHYVQGTIVIRYHRSWQAAIPRTRS